MQPKLDFKRRVHRCSHCAMRFVQFPSVVSIGIGRLETQTIKVDGKITRATQTLSGVAASWSSKKTFGNPAAENF